MKKQNAKINSNRDRLDQIVAALIASGHFSPEKLQDEPQNVVNLAMHILCEIDEHFVQYVAARNNHQNMYVDAKREISGIEQ